MEPTREILAGAVLGEAEGRVGQLVSAIEAANSSPVVAELPAPRRRPSELRQAFAMLYAEFVGSWSVIKP
jgi:hypothetical protein